MAGTTWTRALLGLGAVCVLATGCIPVKNVEKAWAKASADNALTGQWVGTNDSEQRVGFVMTDQGYQVTSGTSGLEGGAKSITVGQHKYVIVAELKAAVLGFENVDDDAKSGNLLRYVIDGDALSIYQYDQDKIEQAIKAGEVPGESPEDESSTLLELDDATMKWLEKIAGEDTGWSETKYTRQK